MSDRVHRNEKPLKAPPDTWERAEKLAQALMRYLQNELHPEPIAHAMSLGALMVGVALMKGTGASRETVMRFAGDLYDRTDFERVPVN